MVEALYGAATRWRAKVRGQSGGGDFDDLVMQKIATWRGYIASAVQAGSLAKIQRGRSGSNGSEAEQ